MFGYAAITFVSAVFALNRRESSATPLPLWSRPA